MKRQQILTLIENEIINTKLVSSLNDIGIDLSVYSLHVDTLIFKSIGLKKDARTDNLYAKYFELLKQGKGIDPNSKSEIRRLALKIYRYLLKHA